MNCAPLHYLFRRGLLALGVISASRLLAQDPAAATAAGPVVELPKFIVKDDRELPQPEAWRYGEIPGFEILTNASDKATIRLIKDFNMFREALTGIWPIPNRSSQPTALILTGKGGKFDAFIPADKYRPDSALASLFLKNKEQTAIVLDLQSTTLNVLAVDTANDAATGTDSNLISVDHDKQLYREYVHYLLSGSEPRLPAWLEEGMAQIIMAMKVEKNYISFGKIEETGIVSAQAAAVAQMNSLLAADDPDGATIGGAPAEDSDFNNALRRRALMPFPKLFAVTHESPEAINPLGNNVWAKQSYAFVHMCLYGRGKRYQKPFAQFLQRLGKEPLSEAMFKEVFKMSYKDMLMELRGYIEMTDYQHQEYNVKGKGLGTGAPLVLRDATQGEIGRIKGEALMLAGHKDKAGIELSSAYKRGERDPRLLAAIAYYDQVNGDEARARKYLEAAVAAKVDRPRAYIELARYRYNDALAKPGDGKNFSAAQVSAVIGPLMLARSQPRPPMEDGGAQPPPPAEVYELMTDTWIHSAAPAKRDDLLPLVEGVRIYPTRMRMLYQVAGMAADAGMLDVAHAFVDYGLKVADTKGKVAFEKLKAALPPAPPEPKDAKAGAPPAKKS